MGFDVGIFWRGLRHGSRDSVGREYGGVVGRSELGRGEVGHGLTVEVSGFWWVCSNGVWGGFLHWFFFFFFFLILHSLLSIRSLWLCLTWVLLLDLFDLMWVLLLGSVGRCGFVPMVAGWCCCSSGCWWLLLRQWWMCCYVVVDGDEREKIIYYFNV